MSLWTSNSWLSRQWWTNHSSKTSLAFILIQHSQMIILSILLMQLFYILQYTVLVFCCGVIPILISVSQMRSVLTTAMPDTQLSPSCKMYWSTPTKATVFPHGTSSVGQSRRWKQFTNFNASVWNRLWNSKRAQCIGTLVVLKCLCHFDIFLCSLSRHFGQCHVTKVGSLVNWSTGPVSVQYLGPSSIQCAGWLSHGDHLCFQVDNVAPESAPFVPWPQCLRKLLSGRVGSQVTQTEIKTLLKPIWNRNYMK